MRLIKLWHICSETEYFILQQQGVYRTDEHLVLDQRLQAYCWMAEQLCKKAPPPQGITLPVWVWYRAHGLQHIKPDLRRKGHLQRGERGVRIELVVPESLVLLSSFDGWHCVLNDHCFALDDAEYRYYEGLQQSYSSKEFNQIKQKSWQRIFDLALLPDPAIYEIQAVMWELRAEWVQKVDFFIAR